MRSRVQRMRPASWLVGVAVLSLLLMAARVEAQTATFGPEQAVIPSSLAFGTQDIDLGPGSPLTVTITNVGASRLSFTGNEVELTGNDFSEFVITGDTNESALGPGASRTVMVAFDPLLVGTKSANLRITTDDGDEPVVNVLLTGIGADQALLVTGGPLDFGKQIVDDGPAMPALSVTITNSGAATLNFTGSGIVIAGIDTAEFAFATAPDTSPLAPAASREVRVIFDPSSQGTKSAALLVTSDGGRVNVGLSGRGTAAEVDVLDGSTPIPDGGGPVDFGTAFQGGPAQLKIFTVKNNGSAPLFTSNLTVPPGYRVIEGLSPSLDGGRSDTFTVELSTAAIGTFAGTISFANNDADENPYDFSVTGTILTPTPTPTPEPTPIDDKTFGPQQIITTQADFALDVFAADLDGDGDLDVLSASQYDDKIAWYENTDGAGTFGPQRVINIADPDGIRDNGNEGDADGAHYVFAADLDGDGDLDVLSGSRFDTKTAWYENTDGLGSFGPQQVISTFVGTFPFPADVDGDGDLDVLVSSFWHENTDGAGNFGPRQTYSTTSSVSPFPADLDGDGDLDIVGASQLVDKIAWNENTDGAGSFGPERVINTPDPDGIRENGNEGDADLPQKVFAADLDGDGDLDVLSASRNDDKIAWYENTDGLGTFGPQRVITTFADYAWWVIAADVDGDGDLDVLSASGFDDKIAWYENTDGLGAFGPQRVITTLTDFAQVVFAADLDGDGDLDVLSASATDDKIAWYENLTPRNAALHWELYD